MRTRGKNKVIFASDWPVLQDAPRRSRGARAGPACRRAGQLPLQQRQGILLRQRDRRTDDGPLRTAQAGLQPVRGPPGDLRRRTSSSSRRTVRSKPCAPQRNPGSTRACGSGLCAMGATTMALPESAGGDGATLGRPDAGGRGDRPLAGAGAVDRPCLRRAAARPAGRAGRRASSTASSSPRSIPQHDNVSGVRLIPTGSIADQIVVRDGDDDRPADVRHPPGQGRQHRQAADGVGGPGRGRQPDRDRAAVPTRWRNTNGRWMNGGC